MSIWYLCFENLHLFFDDMLITFLYIFICSYKNKEFFEMCKKEYLAERKEFRETGVRQKDKAKAKAEAETSRWWWNHHALLTMSNILHELFQEIR